MIATGYSYYFYNYSTKGENFNSSYFLKVFISLNLILGFTTFFRMLFIYMFGISISIKLHGLMLLRILYSSINGFFNQNPIGKVLNRVSGDLMAIDRSIAFNQSYLLNVSSNLIVNFLMVIIFTNWIIGFVFIFIFYFLW